MNKKTKLPKPVRDLYGWKIRPINGGKQWGVYAGKKLVNGPVSTIMQCEDWAEKAYKLSTKVNAIKKQEALNKDKPKKEQVFTGFAKKQAEKLADKIGVKKTRKPKKNGN